MAAEGPRTHLEGPKIWQVKEKVPFKRLGKVAVKSRNSYERLWGAILGQ